MIYYSLQILVLALGVLGITVPLHPVRALSAAQRRDLSVEALDVYVDQITLHAETFYNLVQEPAWNRSSGFEQRCTIEVSGFVNNLRSFQGTLTELAADNAFADSSSLSSLKSELERIRKAQRQVVEGIKYIIEAEISGPDESTLCGMLIEDERILNDIVDEQELREVESGLTTALQQLSQQEGGVRFVLREICGLDSPEA